MNLPGHIGSDTVLEEEFLALTDDCYTRWLSAVESVYINQPAAMELLEQDFAPFKAEVTACLSRLGVNTDDLGTTYMEIEPVVAEVMRDTRTDCLFEAGYYD